MGGRHQHENLSAALAALALLNPGCFTKLDEISAAIRACSVPGRLQKVSSSPAVLLDVGHNELAAEVLAAFFEENKPAKLTCVLAMLADKPAEAVALALGRVCRRWVCTDTSGNRGQTGELLAGRLRTTLPETDISYFGSMGEAMQAAISTAGEDETILVFGSFLTVSAAADWLQNSMQRDRHDAAKIT